MRTSICPICKGEGRVFVAHYPMRYPHYDNQGKEGMASCHGCGGQGWVEIHD